MINRCHHMHGALHTILRPYTAIVPRPRRYENAYEAATLEKHREQRSLGAYVAAAGAGGRGPSSVFFAETGAQTDQNTTCAPADGSTT